MATMMVPFDPFYPNFILISKLGGIITYAGLIVPWCAIAFSFLLIRQAFMMFLMIIMSLLKLMAVDIFLLL